MHLDDRLDGMQEPAVDPRQLVNLVDADAVPYRLGDGENPQRGGIVQLLAQVVEAERVGLESPHADVEHAHRLLDDLGKRAADRHHLADALHFAADPRGRPPKLAEVPAWKLAHQVVQRGFKERGGAARDAVRDLGQRVAERELGGNVGEGIAGRLAGERTRAGEPGVDLDDPVVHPGGVERELDIAFAHDAQMPDGTDRDRAQQLVLRIVERLGRRDDDRIAGVYAHGIEILHVAHRHAVVAGIPHHFVLDFFPPLEGFLHEHLGHAAGERAPQRRFHVRIAPDDAAAFPAERVPAAQHDRQPDFPNRAARRIERTARPAAGGFDSDLGQAPDEQAPILGIANRLDGRPEHLDAVLREDARVMQREAAVQRGLPAEGERDGIYALLDDDLLDELRGHGNEIDAVGELAARLDGRDVRIDQHRGNPFLAQGLDRLGTGIIELAGLSDLQRA